MSDESFNDQVTGEEQTNVPETYLLTKQDQRIIDATRLMLRKIITGLIIPASQIEIVAKVLRQFEAMPRVLTELNDMDVAIELTGPTRKFGEHKISHNWTVSVDSHLIKVDSSGSFWRPQTGHDNFTCMMWQIVPGRAASYRDYLESQRIVDDAQPYETEVARMILSESGYSLSILVAGESLDDEVKKSDDSLEVAHIGSDADPRGLATPPVDQSEKMLMNQCDEARGQREQIFSEKVPHECDLCGRDLTTRKFYLDARHRGALLWANMCSWCFLRVGEGIGCGDGQLFSRQLDGGWLLVGGFWQDQED